MRAMKTVSGLTMFAVALALPAPALASGQQTFSAQCSMCHQPNGAGLPGSFPRLAGRVPAIAGSADGRRYLVKVLLYGLYGPIMVDGKRISGVMPSMKSLADHAVADVLNHTIGLAKPARKLTPFTAAEVAAVRAGARQSGSDIAAERTLLAGRKLIP